MPDFPGIPDRACTPEEKKEIINRLYVAWLSAPHLRLGQLIMGAVTRPDYLAHIEDRTLIARIEQYLCAHQ